MASNGKAVTGTAVMARSADEEKKAKAFGLKRSLSKADPLFSKFNPLQQQKLVESESESCG